ncbi:oleoyl-ACP hydrolase [Streptomyces sp. NRRL B-1568]|uniref:Surfactin synthase thioesterase subunit n=1 Tax=Streptomyces olivoverticillatus TaxID=66427 RepID=A0A7W7PIR3_9ACTN|nr:alpha/beta fold hydrolase [Streptomyces olivoverticillatus]KJY42835.1 oleoyl-ACP hydrolase [Streptomyces sp. NRRL B-1568]MBB4892326.1 surfactin synthase thioesterase subunit [Streptomyces olivoverticillatus]
MTAATADPATANSPWIRRYHSALPTAPRLVCFPHAGGSASFYFPVAGALAPDVDVLAVQYPGRQDRRAEPLVDSVHALADRVFADLRPYAEDTGRPLVFFGHSMGATVAFEVARRIQAAGLPAPARLFASARRAPSRTRPDQVHKRDDDGLIAELRRLSGTDSRVLGNEEIMRMALPAIRNDYKAVETYRADSGVRIDSPVTVFVGDDDPTTSLDEAKAWNEHTTAECELRIFPGGGHFYLADRPAEVIEEIKNRITTG